MYFSTAEMGQRELNYLEFRSLVSEFDSMAADMDLN